MAKTRFSGQTALITGASSGIGAALAEALAAEGARVVLGARRKEKLDGVARRIIAAGGEALPVACDVTVRASLDAAVAETVATFGGLSLVVANAGFGVSGFFEDLTTDDYRRQMETNFFGVVDTIYAALPELIRSKGQIAVVSSVAGRLGFPTSTAYSASKFALIGLCESLYYELREYGVAVTCINPGIVESEIAQVDNQGTHRGERNDPRPSLLMMRKERAALAIVDALASRAPEAVITGHGKLAVWFNRHFPRTFRLALRTATRGRLRQFAGQRRSADPKS